MITSLFLRLGAAFAAFMLRFLPAVDVRSAVDALASAWQTVAPYAAVANHVFGIDVILALSAVSLAARAAAVAWSAINWFWRKVPLIGGR